MFKKKIIIFSLIFFLSSCGFTPIYLNNNDVNFSIEQINYQGDRELNNFLKINLNKYKNLNTDNKIFIEAGFQWRQPGCSMCLAMNDDKLSSKERCASTSNRNFEGRQGRGGRTHLVSPGMAVAAAIQGRLADVRELN